MNNNFYIKINSFVSYGIAYYYNQANNIFELMGSHNHSWNSPDSSDESSSKKIDKLI
jgi:hypothetical protein